MRGRSRGLLAARVITNEMDPERTEELQECWEALKGKATHFTILSRARPACVETSKWDAERKSLYGRES